ncbi:MAG: DEAD/DEAH box helicase [Candidatus Nanohaloarchaeota archaeon QJJ-7]|nr:DEAD/DEAH box helicase [Candidatus Nanohaloarchaeota archaeon QJJ-7]
MSQETLQEDSFIQHPRIVEGSLEARTYQEVIAAEALDQNTIVVLPTGLGKTAVGILVAAQRLEERPNSKILMLAPTKPLAEQHKKEFSRCLEIDTDVFEVLTGETGPEKREDIWKEVGAFFGTPQTVENDIINGRLDLSDFSLVIFDEVHRATGDYPYSFIADKYVDSSDDPRILGLTASPGGDREKIERVADNLYVDNFETRTEDDADVEPYVEEKETNWVKVQLDRNFERVKKQLEKAERKRLSKLKGLGLLDSTSRVQKSDLLKLRGEIGSKLGEQDDPKLYQGMSHVAACMKIEHALELLETQGVKPLYQFFEKMEKDPGSKAAKSLLDDENFRNAMSVTEWMVNNGKEHPKLEELEKLLNEKIEDDKNAIVFTQYRDTVDLIHEKMDEKADLEPVKFKGQKENFTQKRQIEILDEFRDGDYNILVSTSVGEEGLDIPSVDYVFFYEPIPSEIRTIQRRGRTGRQESGEIYVLMAEDTRDEGHYWSAKHKEESMKEVVEDLKGEGSNGVEVESSKESKEGQKTLDGFSGGEELVIIADDRENKVMKELSRKDVKVRSQRLEVGDFLVSDRAAVERKKAEDFVSSIIDNRLFPQLRSLAGQFERPVLLLEGEDLHGHRDIHPNAVRGALSSAVLDFDIPVLWSSGLEETSELLISLARREQEDQDRSVDLRGERSPKTEKELQEYLVAGLPKVSNTLAERLLERFGSVKEVFSASETDLKDVEGIGEEKASRIVDILGREYE